MMKAETEIDIDLLGPFLWDIRDTPAAAYA